MTIVDLPCYTYQTYRILIHLFSQRQYDHFIQLVSNKGKYLHNNNSATSRFIVFVVCLFIYYWEMHKIENTIYSTIFLSHRQTMYAVHFTLHSPYITRWNIFFYFWLKPYNGTIQFVTVIRFVLFYYFLCYIHALWLFEIDRFMTIFILFGFMFVTLNFNKCFHSFQYES